MPFVKDGANNIGRRCTYAGRLWKVVGCMLTGQGTKYLIRSDEALRAVPVAAMGNLR